MNGPNDGGGHQGQLDHFEPTEIAGRSIGGDSAPYIIAELSANHCGDLGTARELIRRCATAGVDAVKIQTYTADTLAVNSSNPQHVITTGPWRGRRLYDLYADAAMPWEWTLDLQSVAQGYGVHFFSTPFDTSAVDFLEQFQVPAYKVASFEIVNFPLLERIAQTGKPIILSTGMATTSEVREALSVLQAAGAATLILLKCTSSYPAQDWELNLSAVSKMQQLFRVPVGFSDHTIGTVAALVALGQGACVFEKHVKLDAASSSVDAFFSIDIPQLEAYVSELHGASKMLGDGILKPSDRERESLSLRPSVMAKNDISRGELLSHDNLVVRRPNVGSHPREFITLLGKRASRPLASGQGVTTSDIETD